jgi:hypothetical protein
MMQKRVLRPNRLRQVPAKFSWIDQRLARENFLRQGEPTAWALYLVLVTVADAEGLSYYSERAVSQLLSMDEAAVQRSRRDLTQAGLIAYQKPLYQVLSLDPPPNQPVDSSRANRCVSIGEVLRVAMGGAA